VDFHGIDLRRWGWLHLLIDALDLEKQLGIVGIPLGAGLIGSGGNITAEDAEKVKRFVTEETEELRRKF
jgi:hypothetical protein